jgi:hypothetical protein
MAQNAAVNFTVSARDAASRPIGRVNKSLGGLSTRSIAVGSAIGTAIGGIATRAIGALTGSIGTAIEKLGEQDKLLKRTVSVLESTGNAANVSSKQIVDMSTSLEMLTGVEAESIQNGENLLLTFTNIRNRVGEGNDIFDQATRAMVDLSAALGQDTKSSAIQLGKALNDPIRGVTALRRVGVSFTDQQTEQIKRLVESGNTLKAQKVILKELNKEFGGAGKAAGESFAGQMQILNHVLTGLVEDALRPLLPIIITVAQFITGTIVPAIQKFSDAFTAKAGPALNFIQRLMAKLSPTLKTLGKYFTGTIVPAVKLVAGALVKNLLPPIQRLINFIATQVLPRFAKLAAFLAQTFGPVVKTIADVFARQIAPALGKVAGFIVDNVLPAVFALADFLSGPLGAALQFIAGIFEVVAKAIGFAVDMFSAFIKAVVNSPLYKIAEAIAGIVGNLFSGGKSSGAPGAANGAPGAAATQGGVPGAIYQAPNVDVSVTLDGNKIAQNVDTRIGRMASVRAGSRL